MAFVTDHFLWHGTLYRSPEEAGEYVRTLQALLRSVGSSDGNMENVGAMRCFYNCLTLSSGFYVIRVLSGAM